MEIRAVAGWPGYFATDDGRILSALRPMLQQLKPTPDHKGYPRVCLVRDDGAKKHFSVHGLVVAAFIGPAPFPGAQVRHLNGNPADSRLDNLKWGTVLENHADKKLHGTTARGERHGHAVLTEAQVVTIKTRLARDESPARIAIDFEVSTGAISSIRRGINWAHVVLEQQVAS